MKIYKKQLKGLSMKAYKDSGIEWVICSTDRDGWSRTERYDARRFTLKASFELHAEIYHLI